MTESSVPGADWTDPGISEANEDGTVTWRPTPSVEESSGSVPGAVGKPTDEERAAWKRGEIEAAKAIMAGDRYCPDPAVHAGGAVGEREEPLDVERLAEATWNVNKRDWEEKGGEWPTSFAGERNPEVWRIEAEAIAAEYARLSVNEGGVAPPDLRAALERLLAVAMTEEEDVSVATQDEWIAAIQQANAALERRKVVERIRDELMHADGFRPDGKRRVNAYNDDISAILDALASESDR
jgi:hypothetical protein